jgi:hypothetical protein
MEAFFTPLDFKPFFDQKNHFGTEAQLWLEEIEDFLLYGNSIPQPFGRIQHFPGVELYKNSSLGRQPKTLLISFAGFYLPLGIPTAVFLQMVASYDCDVLLLNDSSMLGYEKGIPGYANSYEALIAQLKKDFCISRYQSIRLCGMSRGGYASLRAAQDLHSISALSIGGSYPISQKGSTHLFDTLITKDIDHLRQLDISWYQFLEKIKLGQHLDLKNTGDFLTSNSNMFHLAENLGVSLFPIPTVMNAYGEQSKLDMQGNVALQHKFPQLKSCAIEGISDHNLAYILLKQKQLDLFFKCYLFP